MSEILKDEIPPNVNSNDPAVRKRAREIRIQMRLEAARKLQAILDGTATDVKAEKSALMQKILDSNERLFQIFVEGQELVSNIRVASDSREIERREQELAARNVRLENLEAEAAQALEKLQEITDKWDKIQLSNDPLNLDKELQEQKARCKELLDQKEELVKSLREELKEADEKFMHDREDMFADISMLAKRIDEQAIAMKENDKNELASIESAMDEAREYVLKKRQAEWDKLYLQRETEENENLEKKLALILSFEEEIERAHEKHDEKYREIKIRLELEIQTLERELELIKAQCLFNSEKLDYNYQILKKREDENVIIKNHQKRTLVKLQEEIVAMRKKIEKSQSEMDRETKILEKELCRYHANIIDIERKADHFSEINDQKFQKIWEMKTEEATCLLDKITAADKIIYEQVLGLQWSPPELKPIKSEELPSFKAAMKVMNAVSRDELSGTDHVTYIAEEQRDSLIKEIMNSITSQSSFLLEDKLESLLEFHSEDEKRLVQIDNITNAIGITKKEDIDMMTTFFLRNASCSTCRKNSDHAETEDETKSALPGLPGLRDIDVDFLKCPEGHPMSIDKILVLKALQEFVAHLHEERFREQQDPKIKLAKHRCTLSRLISSRDIEYYWARFSKIFADNDELIWDSLQDGVTRYLHILQERHDLNEKVCKLKQQNQELSQLASKYVPNYQRRSTLMHQDTSSFLSMD